MKRALAVVPLLLAIGVGCGSAATEDGGSDPASSDDSSVEALSESDAQPHVFVTPQVKGGAHYWDTAVMQNQPGFDGVIVFGRTAPDAEPDRMMTFDRRTGAVSYVTSATATTEADVATDLKAASQALAASLPDHTGLGTRDFVTPENACFIKMASIAVLVIGAVVAAPFVIEAVAVAATDAATGIAEKGLQSFVTQAARTAWASQKFRKLLAFKVVKLGLKGWLVFSDRGKKLEEPIRRQIHSVIHAKCTPPTDAAITFGGI